MNWFEKVEFAKKVIDDRRNSNWLNVIRHYYAYVDPESVGEDVIIEALHGKQIVRFVYDFIQICMKDRLEGKLNQSQLDALERAGVKGSRAELNQKKKSDSSKNIISELRRFQQSHGKCKGVAPTSKLNRKGKSKYDKVGTQIYTKWRTFSKNESALTDEFCHQLVTAFGLEMFKKNKTSREEKKSRAYLDATKGGFWVSCCKCPKTDFVYVAAVRFKSATAKKGRQWLCQKCNA